jgi:predicted small lipoprotein YifL
MRRLILPIALAVTTATLAGCGQKGPLVLPPATPAGTAAAPQVKAPTPAAHSLAPPPANTSSQPFNSVLQQ